MNEFAEDDRGLLGWKISRKNVTSGEKIDEILYSEELVAVILKYGKQLSEIQAGTPIRDAVITIPSYFDSSQRRMM